MFKSGLLSTRGINYKTYSGNTSASPLYLYNGMLDVVGFSGRGMYANSTNQSSSVVCITVNSESGDCCGYDIYNNPLTCDHAGYAPGQPSSSFLFKSANYSQVSTQTIDNRYYGFKSIAAGGDIPPWTIDGDGTGKCTCTSTSASLGSYSSTYGAYADFGNGFVIGIRYDGTMWSWGANGTGSLGINSTAHKSSPTQIGSDTTWQKVRAGREHALALKTDGTLWSWGKNNFGQLGDSSTTNRSSPVQIPASTSNTWTDISAGADYNIGLQSNGTVWTWGENTYGQLADGTTTTRSSPVQVGALTSWSKIFAGLSTSYFINTSSQLWSCGNNLYGIIGDSTTTNRSSPVQIGSENNWIDIYTTGTTTYGLTTSQLFGWGDFPFSLALNLGNSPRTYPSSLITAPEFVDEIKSGSFPYGLFNTISKMHPPSVANSSYVNSAMQFIYKRGEVAIFNVPNSIADRTIYTGRGYYGATAVTGNATANFILKNANQ